MGTIGHGRGVRTIRHPSFSSFQYSSVIHTAYYYHQLKKYKKRTKKAGNHDNLQVLFQVQSESIASRKIEIKMRVISIITPGVENWPVIPHVCSGIKITHKLARNPQRHGNTRGGRPRIKLVLMM